MKEPKSKTIHHFPSFRIEGKRWIETIKLNNNNSILKDHVSVTNLLILAIIHYPHPIHIVKNNFKINIKKRSIHWLIKTLP